jgi:hypothetical protein
MTFDEYCAVKAVNWSTLKEMARSPLRYRHALQSPKRDTPRLGLGRATHTALFEPDRFTRDYVVFNGDRRKKKIWKPFKEANAGKTILTVEEYDQACRMRDAVLGHSAARELLSEGEPERTITWTDPVTGIKCKARLDWVGPNAIPDLKTTADITARRFASIAARYKYHCQGAWYRQGELYERGGNIESVKPFYLIAVETEEPHDVAVFQLDDDTLYAGERECAELLSAVATCRATNVWPGQYPAIETLPMPAWIWGDEEDLDDSGLVFGDENADTTEEMTQ